MRRHRQAGNGHEKTQATDFKEDAWCPSAAVQGAAQQKMVGARGVPMAGCFKTIQYTGCFKTITPKSSQDMSKIKILQNPSLDVSVAHTFNSISCFTNVQCGQPPAARTSN